MTIFSACRSSLIAAVSVAALSGVISQTAYAQSRPDLDALIVGAATSNAVPAKPKAVEPQQAMRDAPPPAVPGALAAFGDIFRSSAEANTMDAKAAMTLRDGSDRAAPIETSPIQSSPVQMAQSQAARSRNIDSASIESTETASIPRAERRGRSNAVQADVGRAARPTPARYMPADMAVPYDPSYRVDAGDRLRIVVFGQDGLTNTYQIGASGSITMPLIGNVPARGRTPAQLAGAITARLRDGFIRAPSVAVEIEAYRPFFILGEVAAPGQYPYVPNMSVESAVAIAGGFSPRAKRDSVTLTQAMPDGVMRSTVPVETSLRPGDTIMVGERWF